MQYTTINIIRTFAALCIMLFHYTYRYLEVSTIPLKNNITWEFNINWGYGAIATFFVLSGFLSSRYLTKEDNVKKYLTKRFFRLYPTFWLCVIISVFALYLVYKEFPSLTTIIINFTMIPGCFKVNFIDGAYWTMQMEFFFTFIIAIIITCKNKSLKLCVIYIWITLALVFNLLYFSTNNTLITILRIVVMPEYAGTFIGGMATYQILFNRTQKYLYFLLLVLSSISVLINFFISPILLFYLLTIIVLISIPRIEPLCNRFSLTNKLFAYLAILSYPFYLLHQRIGYAILDAIITIGLSSEIIIIIPITITILLAIIAHKYFELPILRFEDKILQKL